MGQYFRFVNVARREYVDGWGAAKLWEWCVNRDAGVFPYLLRWSSEEGGGDVHDRIDRPLAYAGRWAGDECYLVGDYDESGLYQEAGSDFTDITAPLAAEYNAFVEMDSHKLPPPSPLEHASTQAIGRPG
jgi:hypothetical protein